MAYNSRYMNNYPLWKSCADFLSCSVALLLCSFCAGTGVAAAQAVPLATPPQAVPLAKPLALQSPTATDAGSAPGRPTESRPVVLPSYRVKPGDLLEISVYQKPELSKQILVPPDGKIYLPFVGELAVVGLTLGEIKTRLTADFSRQLNNPQITVAILRRQEAEVSVLGAVRTPGKRVLGDNWRILDLLADSGGLSVARPEWVSATLVRGGGAQAIPIDLVGLIGTGNRDLNIPLETGDVLLVREVDATRISLQVLGEVEKPGNVVVPTDGSFATVITAVGGFKPRAALANATLIRGGKSYTIDMRQALTTGKVMTKSAVPQEMKAEAGDTVLVAQNKLLYSVVGAVGRSGSMEYPEGERVSVLTALSLAGGVQGGADLKNTILIRPVPGSEPIVKPINLENLMKNKGAGKQTSKATKDADKNQVDVALLPGDILYVPQQIPGRSRGFGDTLREALNYIPLYGLFVR